MEITSIIMTSQLTTLNQNVTEKAVSTKAMKWMYVGTRNSIIEGMMTNQRTEQWIPLEHDLVISNNYNSILLNFSSISSFSKLSN